MKTNDRLTTDEDLAVRNVVWRFVDLLERVQRLPIPLRLYYYDVVFRVYEILRKRKQLGRRVGGFDGETRQEISDYLTTEFASDGRDED